MALTDIGLAVVLVVLALLMLWRLVDLFRGKGRWAAELAEAEECRVQRGGGPMNRAIMLLICVAILGGRLFAPRRCRAAPGV